MKDRFSLAKLMRLLPEPVAAKLAEDAVTGEVRRKGFARPIEEILPGERAVIRYVSTRDVDRDKEILLPEGAMLDDFLLAPQVLWGHDYSQPPIGSDEWVRADDYGIKVKTIFATTERAQEVWTLIQEGHLRTNSVGFLPVEYVENGEAGWGEVTTRLSKQWGVDAGHFEGVECIYTKWLLLEHSDVPVPSNIHALNLAIGKGLHVSLDLLKQLKSDREKCGACKCGKHCGMCEEDAHDLTVIVEPETPAPIVRQVHQIVRPIQIVREIPQVRIADILHEQIERAKGKP